MTYSADDLARLTAADPARAFPPSPEQRVIIEADPTASMKVTAGAGSGKTTVISQRVVWLVANGHVAPEEILGLTFTRKAVGELGSRIRVLLSRLRHNLGLSSPTTLPGLDSPTVSTYNSYAASIVSEHGASIGIEPETVLLDEAGAHAIAAEIVDAARVEDVPPDVARETMISDMIALAGAMNDHGRDADEVTAYLERCLAALVSSKGKEIDVPRRRKIEAKIRTARLAGAYIDAKRRHLAMDFSDQVRFAQRIVERVPAAVEAERKRWRIVLLDEFQDTSVAQLALLKSLFADTAVTAVGDPRQAIYGWRGASADNMVRFAGDFRDVTSLSLSTSWRNDRSILTVANRIADGLTDRETPLTTRPDAAAGAVEVSITPGAHDPDHVTDGLAALADWVGRLPAGSTKAVLCRKRAHFAAVATALEAAGFAVHVHGSSGLLADPFVADVRALLTVAVDPLAGENLMRLVSGRLLGLGAVDIAALSRFTRRQNDHRMADLERRSSGTETDGDRPAVIAETIDQPTIVEGIDELIDVAAALSAADDTEGRSRRLDAETRRALSSFRESGMSPTALERLVRLAEALRTIRAATGSVASVIRTAVVATGLDSDIWALSDSLRNLHRSAIDSLLSAAGTYSAADEQPTVAGFLDWLSVMEEKDALSTAEPTPDSDVVNIMTVHASKGLEFDAVAVPSLVTRDFPTLPRDKEGWMERTALPYPLRGDRAHLVDFDLSTVEVETVKELKEWISEVIQPQIEDAHAAEERRLAYVAFTRAKHHLWLGAERMNGRANPDDPSPFLLEALDALGLEASIPDPATETPDQIVETATWPVPRSRTVATARQAARWVDAAEPAALADLVTEPAPVGEYARRAERILARPARITAAAMPGRLSATSLVSWRRDPAAFRTQTLRPIPTPPSRAAGIGTAFHSWVEQHYGQASIDIDEDAAVGSGDAETMARLQETFLASEFATRHADHVELSFELVLGRFRVPGKIDAVFISGDHAEVVDWKTSRKPDAATLEVMKWQLALYRLAIRRSHPHIAEVTGTFYFVGSDDVVRVTDLPEESEIISWLEAEEDRARRIGPRQRAQTPTPADRGTGRR
ncbi:DNA helicase-2/ATP-dependent DNA helicase PcrA [Brevibacterium sanguinis]|uniref:DNA 3'-5' helicase n=2 Tax=Brevibacterium TaxID=1696 RepID=A0A366IMP5_9MICO|nr:MULTISPECIES: ATP-dependent DNA helicase [Brevibacterium]RBP66309.1 DNA helicase-2/ATP-dependent DNA helicase PcrA [Brevibacterium sanguinis]RBP72960.1 DNA helicase-2/ATP-dependent DNA helicase PcrA [Brevibacterium celere]